MQHDNLYESPAFKVSHEGLEELLAEVKRVDALISNKPPGHPVSLILHTECSFCLELAQRSPATITDDKSV